MFPDDVVDGVGAVDEPVPPLTTVYHNRLLPVAVNAVAVAFKQYTTGVVTPGAVGKSLTVTVAVCPITLEEKVEYQTLVSLYSLSPGVSVGTATETVSEVS